MKHFSYCYSSFVKNLILLKELIVIRKNHLTSRTDKKENQIFLIYKEIQSGAVAKSYMRKCANP
jgi:hypothetical protein